MASTDDEIRSRFERRYAVATADVSAQIEQRVIGAAWGSNGYTTKAQADELGAHLRLGAGDRLLDIGSGRGWPGLYLAATSGCSAVLLDLPMDALLAARRKAAREGLGGTVSQVMASATAVPLKSGAFDGVVHTDVLC